MDGKGLRRFLILFPLLLFLSFLLPWNDVSLDPGHISTLFLTSSADFKETTPNPAQSSDKPNIVMILGMYNVKVTHYLNRVIPN